MAFACFAGCRHLANCKYRKKKRLNGPALVRVTGDRRNFFFFPLGFARSMRRFGEHPPRLVPAWSLCHCTSALTDYFFLCHLSFSAASRIARVGPSFSFALLASGSEIYYFFLLIVFVSLLLFFGCSCLQASLALRSLKVPTPLYSPPFFIYQ